MAREREISRLLVSLGDTLVGDFEVIDLLQRLVDGAKSVLAVDAAGVLVGQSPEHLAVTAASDEDMKTLEVFELQGQSGPCYTAYISGEPLVVADLDAEHERWPKFVPRALELGFQSAAAFPLRLRDQTIGALNLFRHSTGAFSEADLGLGQALADMAAIGIIQERAITEAEVRARQLQYALDSRVMIEQAKGMLAERLDIPPGEAFARMRDHSRSHNTKLREICRRVIDEGFVPADQAGRRDGGEILRS